MPRRRFTLKPLQVLREQQAELRREQLGDTTRALKTAAEQRGVAEQRVQVERSVAQRLLAAERQRLEDGQVSVAELQRAGDFSRGAEQRARVLEQRAEAARRAEKERRAEQERARQALAEAEAQRAALDKHRERFDREQLREAELAEDEASAEVWQSRRHRGEQ